MRAAVLLSVEKGKVLLAALDASGLLALPPVAGRRRGRRTSRDRLSGGVVVGRVDAGAVRRVGTHSSGVAVSGRLGITVVGRARVAVVGRARVAVVGGGAGRRRGVRSAVGAVGNERVVRVRVARRARVVSLGTDDGGLGGGGRAHDRVVVVGVRGRLALALVLAVAGEADEEHAEEEGTGGGDDQPDDDRNRDAGVGDVAVEAVPERDEETERELRGNSG
jgi:hypothetical protein